MEIHKDFDLSGLNTFRVKVAAEYFASFSSIQELQNLIEQFHSKNKLVLGGGSNVLFTKNISGVVLHNRIKGIEIIKEDEEFVWLKAGAGENWHQFVMYSVHQNLEGLENLSLIPGSTGAAPMQNIGAYGVEIKDVFSELQALNIADNTVRTFSNEDCRFGYRESIFKNQLKHQFVILNITCRLRKQPEFNISYGTVEKELEAMGIKQLSVKAISDVVIRIRTAKLPDPAVIGNAGSFFKNPLVQISKLHELQKDFPSVPFYNAANGIKIPAAWLIEQCGFKGYREGDVGCYQFQPLVIVNYGNASGIDIFEFSEKIIDTVKERFGIELQREVNVY